MIAEAVRTTCPYCGVGCGLLAKPTGDGRAEIAGDPHHPANFGRLCSKGSALGETLSLDDRLLHPMIDGVRVTWDQALDRVAARFAAAIEQHGPDSVAFYVSGQILIEDYYVANKLMKGFIGSANIDTNSRLCMASSVAGHRRAFGADIVPGTYEDLELAELVVLAGSNLAWCHPVLFRRLAEARQRNGTKVVVIDPRRTATCDIADLHLPLAPGSDVALFAGLFAHLVDAGACDAAFIADHTNGYQVTLDAARALSPQAIAATTGLGPGDIAGFNRLFAATEKVVTVYSQGINQSSSGTDKVNAIINCHLATGRIGHPGMGPFSVTGQPNAMGGREVGGLANMLAAHMELDDARHRRIVQQYWGAARVADRPGLKAIDMFEAVGDGRIKALWIIGTNPVDSMPQADRVVAALKKCPFVVVSDVVRHTDTTALAHVLLPSAAWGEKDGTVTNSERRISRQRRFLPVPGEARADWWQLAEVARRLGHGAAFDYHQPSQIFAEHAGLTAAGNAGSRDLDIGAHAGIDAAGYATLEPFQWPQPAGAAARESRFFADARFYTPDRKARMVPTPWRPPAASASSEFPLLLNTGRSRDQWHTMTRTAKSPRLMGHAAEPYLEIHPLDANRIGLSAAALALVESANGSAVLRTVLSDRLRVGALFAPMHWNDRYASRARIDALIGPACDAISGQPELKHTPVRVSPFAARWYGFAVGRGEPVRGLSDYWALARQVEGWRMELAGLQDPADWAGLARVLLGTAGELLSYSDSRTGQWRFAVFEGQRLLGALFVARAPVVVARQWLVERLLPEANQESSRLRLLAARPGAAERDRGPAVCACFGVGANEIVAAVLNGSCISLEAISERLKAGSNCGSCRSDIQRILHETRHSQAR